MPLFFRRRIIALGAVAPVFLPSDIADLVAKYDGSAASTLWQESTFTTPATPGDVVGGWQDGSGVGNDGTQTTTAHKPAVLGAAQNGLNVVHGDGADDNIDISVALTNETIFVVAKNDVATNLSTIIAVGTIFRIRYAATNIDYRYNTINATIVGGFTETDFNLFKASFNGSQSSFSVNDGTPVTASPAAAAHTYTHLFAELTTRALLGSIAELLIYSRDLLDAESALVNNYLKTKWNTP